MNTTIQKILLTGCLATCSHSLSAAPIATFGGSTVTDQYHHVTFEGNVNLANHWLERGLVVSYNGSGNNNDCGYAGLLCFDAPGDLGPGFEGNFMATFGNAAHISIRDAAGRTFSALEFAVGSLFVNPYATPTANVFGRWQTLRGGVQTGAGNFSRPSGSVLGLVDPLRFDEVRFYAYAFNSATSGFSAPIVDSIRAQVPEPATLGLLAIGAFSILIAGRRRVQRIPSC